MSFHIVKHKEISLQILHILFARTIAFFDSFSYHKDSTNSISSAGAPGILSVPERSSSHDPM